MSMVPGFKITPQWANIGLCDVDMHRSDIVAFKEEVSFPVFFSRHDRITAAYVSLAAVDGDYRACFGIFQPQKTGIW